MNLSKYQWMLDYGIPRDQLEHIVGMLSDNDVTLGVAVVQKNPYLSLENMQKAEDARTAQCIFATPRLMSNSMYYHKCLRLTSGDKVRCMYWSSPKEVYTEFGELRPLRTVDTPKDITPLYDLMHLLRVLAVVEKPCIDNDFYGWMECRGYASCFNDDTAQNLQEGFKFDKDHTDALIDIFGQDTLCDAFNCLSTNKG